MFGKGLAKQQFLILVLVLLLSVIWGDESYATYELTSTSEILLTSSAGDKLATQENVPFIKGNARG
ncbi:MAG: hypothetical protein MIO92_14155, partial [Methanosarcinaceae archaeon]|nr:hypothetical protein [Methanosarcinaceae archaeon]